MLVTVALLFCHGAFGYAHQLELTDATASPVAHAGGSGVHHPTQHDADGEHPPGGYLATLLVLLAMLLPPLLVHQAKMGSPVPVSSGRRPTPDVFHPPRGPTLPVLQVFRL